MHSQSSLFDLPLTTPRQRRRSESSGEARTRKMNGQFAAANKAGSLWMELALDKLRLFLRERKAEAASGIGQPEFTFEEFRVRSEIESWPLPSSVNAWGALPSAAARKGLCKFTGRAVEAKRAESHGRLVKVWLVL